MKGLFQKTGRHLKTNIYYEVTVYNLVAEQFILYSSLSDLKLRQLFQCLHFKFISVSTSVQYFVITKTVLQFNRLLCASFGFYLRRNYDLKPSKNVKYHMSLRKKRYKEIDNSGTPYVFQPVTIFSHTILHLARNSVGEIFLVNCLKMKK